MLKADLRGFVEVAIQSEQRNRTSLHNRNRVLKPADMADFPKRRIDDPDLRHIEARGFEVERVGAYDRVTTPRKVLVIGGGMANTFLFAQGALPASILVANTCW